MPVATIGLFAMAVVVIGIALLISRAVGDDDGGPGAYDPGVLATTAAQKTAQAGKTTTTQTTQPSETKTPGTPATPGTPGTPGTATATSTGSPGASGKTYAVVSGDTCGGIAAAHDITLKQLLDLNGMTEDDCTKLQIGQKLKLP